VGWLSRVEAARRAPALGLILLIGANLIPLIGVLFFDWDVGLVLIAYWVENGIVGILNVPRILLAAGGDASPPTRSVTNAYGHFRMTNAATLLSSMGSGGKAILAVFFLFHYGIFWTVHGVFLNVFLNLRGLFGSISSGTFSPVTFDPFRFVLADTTVLIAALALFVSHLANLVVNYIGRGEYRTATPGGQMFAPYPRMIALHVTIIVGGLAIMGLGQPFVAVLLLVVIKTIIDVGIYRFDRRRFTNRQAEAQPAAIV
jgi:hypothetical protein